MLHVYVASKELPTSESLGLAAHLRRSAVSIPRAIAEGAGRDADHEFAADLKRSRAAAHELEYILLLCRDLGFFAPALHDDLLAQLIEVRKMTSGLISTLNASPAALR